MARLVRLLAVFLVTLASLAGTAQAAVPDLGYRLPRGYNLVQNPGGEGLSPGSPITPWTASQGGGYGAVLGQYNQRFPAPPGGGSMFFAMFGDLYARPQSGTATQTITLSKGAVNAISSWGHGRVEATLSALLGVADDVGGSAGAVAQFLDKKGKQLGPGLVAGPVDLADLGGSPGLAGREATAIVPDRALKIRVVMKGILAYSDEDGHQSGVVAFDEIDLQLAYAPLKRHEAQSLVTFVMSREMTPGRCGRFTWDTKGASLEEIRQGWRVVAPGVTLRGGKEEARWYVEHKEKIVPLSGLARWIARGCP